MAKEKKTYWKSALLGLLAIACYFVFSYLEEVPLLLLGIDTSTLSTTVKTIYLLVYQVLLLGLIIYILKDSFLKDMKDIKKNHEKYFKTYFKYWFLLLGLMFLSNSIILLIMKFVGTGTSLPENEELIRSNFQIAPIYVYLSSVLIAPIMEELIFRRGIRNIIKNNTLFILVSGFIFGGLHVFLAGMQTP
ncbi:MAG: hypothetical protein KH135_04830, partial [Firmicutes bacterium]|nr:hypothetical protein [Bacillota bacterium]